MKSGFTSFKDTDTLILDAVDDATLLKILQLNQHLLRLGDDAFRRRMQQRYPVLAKLKPYNITWGKYYLSMVFYINKLKEEFDIDYIPVSSFNPAGYYTLKVIGQNFDKNLKDLGENMHMAEVLAEFGDEKLIRDWIDKHRKYSHFIPAFLLKYKNIPLFEKFYDPNSRNKTTFDPNFRAEQIFIFLEEAAESGDKNVLNYILDKMEFKIGAASTGQKQISPTEHYNALLRGVGKSGNMDMLYYVAELIPKFKINISSLLSAAARKGKIAFIKSFVSPENAKVLIKELPDIIESLLLSEYIDVLTPELKEKTLRFLLDTYFQLGGKRSKPSILEDQLNDENSKRILREYYKY